MSGTDGNRDGRKLRTLGLFAGCGGLDMGFEQSGGFRIVAANEFWKQAAATYRLNHPDTVLVDGDITSEETKRAICAHFEKESCEAIIGGAPCQAYSVAGNRNQDDPRGALYEDYVEIVFRLRPLVVVMENVVGILTMVRPDGTPVKKTLNHPLLFRVSDLIWDLIWELDIKKIKMYFCPFIK